MLSVVLVGEIEQHLARIPGLVDAFEHRRPAFYDNALAWIRELEVLLTSNKVPQGSEVALLRAGVLSVARSGRIEAERNGVTTKRRRVQKDVAALEALRRAGALVAAIAKSSRDLMTEAENVARQIAAIAKTKSLYQPRSDDWAAAMAAWRSVASDDDLIALVTHVLGLVGLNNAVLIYSRATSQV